MSPFAKAYRSRATHEAGKMNRLEQAYASSLQMMLLAREIQSYQWEPLKLKLAPNTTYSPDFMVVANDGTIELHEVKGFWEDDARVKIKVAAQTFPMFKFVAFTRKKGVWKEESF